MLRDWFKNIAAFVVDLCIDGFGLIYLVAVQPDATVELRQQVMRGLRATARLLSIFISQFEQGRIGPDLFRKACEFQLEGLVSKRRDRPYRAGPSKDWVKVKNRNHPAMYRVKDAKS